MSNYLQSLLVRTNGKPHFDTKNPQNGLATNTMENNNNDNNNSSYLYLISLTPPNFYYFISPNI